MNQEKDAADPMDFLSRHPLEDTESDDTERIIKMIVFNEHRVIMDRIKEATSNDQNQADVKKKFWFQRLNSLVEDIISRCFQCQISSDEPKHEAVML